MKKKIPFGLSGANTPHPSECNGCGVCMLSCPVWMQHKTQALTYCGRTRAAIGGAQEQDLAQSARACILCGSCETLCPRGIRTQQSTIALRHNLRQQGLFPSLNERIGGRLSGAAGAPYFFIPGRSLRAHPSLTASVQHVLTHDRKDLVCYPDDGQDITRALEAGLNVNEERVSEFITPLTGASEIIVADGMMVNLLHALLPSSIVVRPLGHALLEHSAVRKGLKQRDFYMIETRAYNARRKELAAYYDTLRKETGCFMNLDLHRVATPTGASSVQHIEGLENAVSIEAQVKWLLEGRAASRIVVEHMDDHAAFSRYASLPVIHLAEVLHG